MCKAVIPPSAGLFTILTMALENKNNVEISLEQ
jgi:hypothetical protein